MSGKLFIFVGLPGSGKTTAARFLVESNPQGTAIAISRDDLRMMYYGTKVDLTSEQERQITVLEHQQIRSALVQGLKVFVHDCNLRMDYRKALAKIAVETGSEWEQLDLTVDVTLEQALSRNGKRPNPVPVGVITDMWERYVKPNKGHFMKSPEIKPQIVPPARELYVRDQSKPRVIMVDVDGTVAKHEGVRSPYDTSKYHLDKPNDPVIALVQREIYAADSSVDRIVFCSGRHEDFRKVTEEWLFENVRVPFDLYMRENQGVRDDIEKLDLFDKYIRPNYNVLYVLDDRDRVVKAWRSIGLTCLQVAPGDF